MPSVEETTRYFEEHAGRLRADRLVDKSSALKEILFDRIAPRSRVLEVGAGTGLYTLPLLDAGHHVTAVDLSESCLEQIRGRVQGGGHEGQLTTRAGEFGAVAHELAPGTLDAVVFIKVLHHFASKDAIRSALHDAYRLLAPGGKILIFEPNGSYPLWPAVLLARGVDYFKNEKNVFLIRRRFFESVLDELPGARHSCRYRFVVPGGIVKRAPLLGKVDRWLCREDHQPFGGRFLLDKLAVNIAFEAEKPR